MISAAGRPNVVGATMAVDELAETLSGISGVGTADANDVADRNRTTAETKIARGWVCCGTGSC